MYCNFSIKNALLLCSATLLLTVYAFTGTKAADSKNSDTITLGSSTTRRLAIMYIPYSPYTYSGTSSATLEKCLRDAIKSNKFRPNGPFMYDTVVATKQQVDSIVELFDTKTTPANYPSGEAEILIEDQLTGKETFVDQYGVVKTDTQQYQLKPATFERLHNLLRQIMPPLAPNKIGQHH